MATSGAKQPTSGDGKSKAKVSPVRNVVGLVLLVVFAGAATVEFVAINGFNTAVGALKKRMPKDEDDPGAKNAELPTKSEVEKLLGKAPDGPLETTGGGKKATYTWQGLRKHVLTAYYSTGKDPALIRTE